MSVIKTFGDYEVHISEGWPRRVSIKKKGEWQNLIHLELEEARDLQYMLGRAIAIVDGQDSKK